MLPLRILFFIPTAALTGGPRVVLNFLDLLDRSLFTPVVVTTGFGPLLPELERRKVAVHVECTNLLGNDGAILRSGRFAKASAIGEVMQYNYRMFQFLRRERIDLIWARNVASVILIGFAARSLGVPLVWDMGVERESVGVVKMMHWTALRLAGRVVTEARRQIPLVFGTDIHPKLQTKITTIEPGLDQARIDEIRRPVESNKRSDFRHGAALNLIQIGTISPRKNQLTAIRAIQRLKQTDIRLHLVGGVASTRYAEELRAYIRENALDDMVVLYGWQDQIPDFLASADVLLMTSTNEGVPYAVHEAMHAGLPSIVSDSGGMPEAVIQGKTGFIVPTNDVEAIAEAIATFIKAPDQIRHMGRAARRLAQTKYVATRWYREYESLLTDLSSEPNQ